MKVYAFICLMLLFYCYIFAVNTVTLPAEKVLPVQHALITTGQDNKAKTPGTKKDDLTIPITAAGVHNLAGGR